MEWSQGASRAPIHKHGDEGERTHKKIGGAGGRTGMEVVTELRAENVCQRNTRSNQPILCLTNPDAPNTHTRKSQTIRHLGCVCRPIYSV